MRNEPPGKVSVAPVQGLRKRNVISRLTMLLELYVTAKVLPIPELGLPPEEDQPR